MRITLTNQFLDEFNLINDEYLVSKAYYRDNSGMNEYRLYSYLSTFFNHTTILDIGTLQGRSAIALSYNETNQVISYDIRNSIPENHVITTKQNITFVQKNVLDDLTEDFIQNVKIVVIDIDHYETIERQILDRLKEINFSGIIILDDVFYHPDTQISECMNRLWSTITEPKVDVTKYGHITGTGIVIMNDTVEFELA